MKVNVVLSSSMMFRVDIVPGNAGYTVLIYILYTHIRSTYMVSYRIILLRGGGGLRMKGRNNCYILSNSH